MCSDSARRSDRVTRRSFLGAAGLAGLALTGSETAAADGTTSAQPYDVIIIGAGFCGITAARECTRMGYRSLIVEARNRIGGRTFTVPFNGKQVDVGGMWIHWSQPYVWTEWLRSGLALEETPGASADRLLVHTSRGERLDLSFQAMGAKLEQAIAAYMGDTRSLLPLPHDARGTEALRHLDVESSRAHLDSIRGLSHLYRDLVDGYLAGCGHNGTREFSHAEMVRWFALAGHSYTNLNDATGRYHLKDGTIALLSAMLAEAGATLRLGAAVRRVESTADGVRITTSGGEVLSARVAISTVPLNVLRDVEWRPGLSPQRLEASRIGHAGRGTKVHLLLDGDLGNFTALAPSQFPINAAFVEGVEGRATHVVGFGPDPEQLDVNDTDSVQEAIRLFLPSARVLKSLGYDWNLDPFSRGTWCTLRPGMWSRDLQALQEPSDRIVFASADWASGWRGFIDGAIEQGLRAGASVRHVLS